MKKYLPLMALSIALISPNLFAQNVLKDAVRLNRDIKETKSEYKDELRRTKHKLNKVERNAAKKVEKIKGGLDPKQQIKDKVSREIKQKKRKAITNWLAE